MDENNPTRFFEDGTIRTVWNEEQEWYFSVQDVIAVLTKSIDPNKYKKKMRIRDPVLSANWGAICTPIQMPSANGKIRRIQAVNTEGLLRIVQSISSPEAEIFKCWLARIGRERIEETLDPELAIERVFEIYKKKGCDKDTIHRHFLSFMIRDAFTAEKEDHGIPQNKEHPILIDEITRAWSVMTSRQHRGLDAPEDDDTGDNMTVLKMILNMLEKAASTDGSKADASAEQKDE